MSLLKSDGSVVINSQSAGFAITVMTGIAITLHTDCLGSISIFFGLKPVVQFNKDDGLPYSTSNGFFCSGQCLCNNNILFGGLVCSEIFRKSKENDQLISGVKAEQIHQNH